MKFTRVLSFAIIGILLTCETCLVSAEFTGYPGVHNCTMPGVVALTFGMKRNIRNSDSSLNQTGFLCFPLQKMMDHRRMEIPEVFWMYYVKRM